MLTNSGAQQQPAQPVYVLRGHSAQIHSLLFVRENERLVTADADGWVVLWKVATRRPVSVWKAHEGAVMRVAEWRGRILTHGRDSKLFAWKLGSVLDEAGMDIALPVDEGAGHRRSPWLLGALDVNALNFCGFAMCAERRTGTASGQEENEETLLIAVPSALNSDSVDIMRLPTKERVHASIGTTEVKTGMAMALAMLYSGDALLLVAGYESGHAAVYKLDSEGSWSTLYLQNPHSQPVLSLSVSPSPDTVPYFLTSGADAIIAKHHLPVSGPTSAAPAARVVNTKHSGQQSISVRSDGKIFATAGWDSRIRVYSVKTMKELAVLKWHRDGCYAVAFGRVLEQEEGEGEGEGRGGHGTLVTAEERRRERVRAVHWVAGGAKDGKVSLWEIY